MNTYQDDSKLFANRFPEFAIYLLHSEDGYKYYGMSAKKVDWICPYCGSIVHQIPLNKVATRRRIPCKKCSDGISYPNKVMYNMLMQLHEDFLTEYSPNWIKPKRFDFFIPSKQIIIEMDGAIGHGHNSMYGNNADYLLLVDKSKDEIAYKNHIKVIRIDCYYSDIEYISQNIKDSELCNIYDLSQIDWHKCDCDSQSSLQIIVCNLWNKTNSISYIIEKTKLSRKTIIRYLHRCNKLGLCVYKSKLQQTISGKNNIAFAYNKNKKSVICLENNKIFESCREAYLWLGYNIDGHSIQDNCKGITQSAGKHPVTKEKLHWMFYDEYKGNQGGE